MQWRFLRSAVPVLLIAIHLSAGYDTVKKPVRYPDDDPYFPPYVTPAFAPKNAETTPVRRPISTPKGNFAEPTPGAQISSQVPSVYDGCDSVKGCLGLPGGSCVQDKSCSALVTFVQQNQRIQFELWAINSQADSFVAVGLSDDNKMGDDSVTECTVVNGRVNVYMSRNEGKSNIRLENPTSGLNVTNVMYRDGNLYCKFERATQFVLGNQKMDLSSQMYYLLLARGLASSEGISYHGGEKTVSARSLKLSETGVVGASKGTLVKLHGTFMVMAWMLFGSCGILLARYYKLTWVGQQIGGKDLWFAYHRILMMVTWTLTVIAFVLIFVELGGWTSIPATQNAHAVIGLITTLLAFIQPFMAFFRPNPDAPRRFIFNWAHWTVGKFAHTLGIVCIYLAVGLDKAAIPYWITWLLVVYTVIYVLSDIVLSVAQYAFHGPWSPKPTPGMAMKDMMPPHQSYQDTASLKTTKTDAYGSHFRRTYLFFYILLIASFSIAVIATIANGPWTK